MSQPPPKPPMAIEQWLSIVLALPSHRSSHEGHRAFGSRLMKMVFDELPAQYAEDETARCYLNSMLAEVAWAVRGFSAARDDFERGVQASAAVTEHERERARGWAELSPLKKESLGAKGVAIAVGAGGATALSRAFPSIPVGWNVALVIVLAYAVHLFLDWLQASTVKRALQRAPKGIQDNWSGNARPRYIAISSGFLCKALAVERRFYPESVTPKEDEFDAMIARAFAFGDESLPKRSSRWP